MSKRTPTATRRFDPPSKPTDRDEPQAFRVWTYIEWTGWTCIATFHYLSCFLDYLADCQDKGVLVVRQCPLGCKWVKPTDQRVVAK